MNIFEKQMALSGSQGRLINPYFVLGIQYDFARQHEALLPELMRKMLKTLMNTYHPDKLAARQVKATHDPDAYAVQLAQALGVVNDPDSLCLARQVFFDAGAGGHAERLQAAERRQRQQAEHQLGQLRQEHKALQHLHNQCQQQQQKLTLDCERWQSLALHGVKRQTATPLWAIESLEALSVQATPVAESAGPGICISELLQALDQLPAFTQWHYHWQRQQGVQHMGRACPLAGQVTEIRGPRNTPLPQAVREQLAHWLEALQAAGAQKLSKFSLSTGSYRLIAPKRLERTALAGKKAPQGKRWAPCLLGGLPLDTGLRCKQEAKKLQQDVYLADLVPASLSRNVLSQLPELDPVGLMPGDWLVYAQNPNEDWPQARHFYADLLLTAIQPRP